ncbi:hypothetical protein ColTof4_14068 [Colletotrichum tofieldiae]|nr:hypothetical protein ColTof3_14705 [Colletotrichum tofieldiae]GKT81645.1 hypothetical protein ColTof4_14068 [Colletotrichum tofieldiae]
MDRTDLRLGTTRPAQPSPAAQHLTTTLRRTLVIAANTIADGTSTRVGRVEQQYPYRAQLRCLLNPDLPPPSGGAGAAGSDETGIQAKL